jgi:hypothetical protein
MYKPDDYAVLRGYEVLLHGIKDCDQAIRLADELTHTNELPIVVVKVQYAAYGKRKV